MFDLSNIAATPEAEREARGLMDKHGAADALTRLVQLMTDTADKIVSDIRAGGTIDPAPYRALRLRTKVQRTRDAIETILATNVTNQQVRAIIDAIETE